MQRLKGGEKLSQSPVSEFFSSLIEDELKLISRTPSFVANSFLEAIRMTMEASLLMGKEISREVAETFRRVFRNF